MGPDCWQPVDKTAGGGGFFSLDGCPAKVFRLLPLLLPLARMSWGKRWDDWAPGPQLVQQPGALAAWGPSSPTLKPRSGFRRGASLWANFLQRVGREGWVSAWRRACQAPAACSLKTCAAFQYAFEKLKAAHPFELREKLLLGADAARANSKELLIWPVMARLSPNR